MIDVVQRRTAWIAVSVLVVAMVAGCTTTVPGAARPAPGEAPSAAPVRLSNADMEAAPCEALAVDQVRQLGHLPPGVQVDEDLGDGGPPNRECRWFGPQGGVELSLSSVPILPGSPRAPLPLFEPVTVGGLPGSAVSVGGEYCTLGVDHPGGRISVSTFRTEPLSAEQACDGAAALAELVIENLATGVPGGAPSAVAGPSVVAAWAADPCAALSPLAVSTAVGPGAVPQPEEPRREEAGCRWAGPAASMRLVAVLVDTVYSLDLGLRRSAVGSRPVLEELVGTTCTLYARFPFGQLLLLAVDDPAGGAEQACVRARTAAAELLAV